MCRSSPEQVSRCRCDASGGQREATPRRARDSAKTTPHSDSDTSAWREVHPTALGSLDQNREVAMLRFVTSKLDPCSKRHQPCVPAAKVEERFSSFFEEYEDESECEDDDSVMVGIENAGRTENVLCALHALGRARDEQLAQYMEPLVDEGASALRDAAQLATYRRGAPLTFGA